VLGKKNWASEEEQMKTKGKKRGLVWRKKAERKLE